MPIVSNTSPITNLAAIGRIDLLQQIYGEIIIPSVLFSTVETLHATSLHYLSPSLHYLFGATS
jgi:predicted nucleic acid-binding protein